MEYQNIGKLLKPRGLKGEIKIRTSTNLQNELFKSGNILYIENDGVYQSLVIDKYRRINKDDFLSFNNKLDINLIEELIGKDVFIDKNIEINLNKNEFLVSNLVGVTVKQNAKIKGKVIDVYNYPQGDYLLVKTDDGDKLIPFNERFIIKQTEAEIEVVDMEGLF
ncbi:MAG: ribosome maturation factor RimM [Candidatus Izemoplasmatales bacterium]